MGVVGGPAAYACDEPSHDRTEVHGRHAQVWGLAVPTRQLGRPPAIRAELRPDSVLVSSLTRFPTAYCSPAVVPMHGSMSVLPLPYVWLLCFACMHTAVLCVRLLHSFYCTPLILASLHCVSLILARA